MTEARSCSQQHVVVIGAANSAGQAAVHFAGYASRVTMLVRGPSLEKSMSHYLIEQLAALPNVEVRTGSSATEAIGEDGRLRALRVRDADGESELDVDACFVFIGASPHTDWLEGVVARDEHGFILAGPDVRRRRMAAEARPAAAGDERARRVRGRRRARALDQARRQRGRRGLDGGVAHPPVPRRGMSTVSGTPVTLAELRRVDLFDGIDDAQLGEWLAVAELHEVEPGELIAEEQDHVPGLILLLEGTAMTQMTGRGNPEPLGHQIAPTWIGAISLLTEDPLPVRISAESPCRLAIIQPADFERLVFAQRAVHQTVIRRIAPVMQRLGGIEQNRERLASLGTMAAGLTHELNNPAAAARRAASQLAEEVAIVQKTLVKFVKAGVERADAEVLVDLQQEAVARAACATALDTLDAADAEDELLERLEALNVPEPWRLAEPLASAGIDQDWLDRVAAHAGARRRPRCTGWRRR